MSAQSHEATSGSAVPTDWVEQLVGPVVEVCGPVRSRRSVTDEGTVELYQPSGPRLAAAFSAWPIWRLAEDPPLHSWYLETFECLDGATHRLVRMVLENLVKGLVRVGLQD
jgi:hypothetical protein